MNTTDPVALVLSRLKGVKENSTGFTALCPAHDDRRNSLSICPGDDGRALLKCHAGCETAAIVAAAGLTMADLFSPHEETIRGNGQGRSIVAIYDYRDQDGTPLYQTVRFDPKDF